MKTKQEIREEIRRRLGLQTGPERAEKSRRIERKLFEDKAFRAAKRVLIYLSLPEEVDTLGVIRKCLEERKTVILPRVENASSALELREIRDIETDCERGRYGLLEPRRDRTTEADPGSIDCAIVPGLAFDAAGNRLGRGGGHFDRLLARIPKEVPRVALAFSFQIVERVPVESHDRPVDRVLSD